MDLASLATTAGGFAGAAVGIGALIKFVVAPIRKLLRQQEEFRDDWFGSPARPGRVAVPGIPERLAWIENQLCPHTNGSLYATVQNLDRQLTDHLNTGGTP